MKIKVKKIKDVPLPEKESDGAARYDLRVYNGQYNSVTGIIKYNTYLAMQIPKGYEMEIVPRSSTWGKYGVELANTIGVIDDDYRGEIFIMCKFAKERPPHIKDGTRLVQFKIVKQGIKCDWVVSSELEPTERGDGAMGSTGER